MKKHYLLVVDPFSSSAAFAQRAKELYGFDTIALITNRSLPEAVMKTFKKEDYHQVFLYRSLDGTASEIEDFLGQTPDFIICGSESGVNIFDLLCEKWKLPQNIFELSSVRRDKFLMQAQLKNSNIRYIPHFKSGDLSQILQWCEENPFHEYVIKPICSFGSDGVFFCKNIDTIEKIYHKLINTLNYMGHKNSELLIEQKIEGIEYVVDAVSCDGIHFIVNIFKYIKEEVNGVPIYRQMFTEPVSEHPELIQYVKKVLTSLGIVNGASHNEVIMTVNGPVLVESGARMHGGLGPRLVEESNSHSLIDLSLIARISPLDFRNRTLSEPILKKYAAEYFLSAPATGTVSDIDIENNCSALPSYSFTTNALMVGDFICMTVDLVTSYGRIVLINSDRDILKKDVTAIGEMEKKDMLIRIENLL